MTTSVAEGLTVTVLQSALKPALDRVARIATTRSVLASTAMVLVEANEGVMTLTTTNLEQAMVCQITAKVTLPGRVLVPAKLFADLIGRLPDSPVELDLTGKTLTVKCARSVARLQTMDADDFPPVPQPKGDVTSTTVDAITLRDALRRVADAAARDDSRPVLNTVLFEAQDVNALTLVAADGFRVAVETIPAVTDFGTWMLPLPAVTALTGLLGGHEGNVTLSIDGRVATLTLVHSTLASTTLTMQLAAGQYPDWPKFVPQEYTARTVMATGELMQAVRTAQVLLGKDSVIVRLVPTDGGITVSGQSEGTGDGASTVDAEVEGQPVRIAFNGGFLLDALEGITTPEVALETTTTGSVAVLRPVGDSTYMHIIVPMFVQWEEN